MLLKYAPVPTTNNQHKSHESKTASLEDLLASKVQSLSAILAHVQKSIVHRKALSERVLAQIDQHYLYLKTKLFEVDSWPVGGVRAIEQRRGSLEKQLDTLNQEGRKEQVQCWQDTANLETELRRWFKEYADLAGRVRLVLGR